MKKFVIWCLQEKTVNFIIKTIIESKQQKITKEKYSINVVVVINTFAQIVGTSTELINEYS